MCIHVEFPDFSMRIWSHMILLSFTYLIKNCSNSSIFPFDGIKSTAQPNLCADVFEPPSI